MTQEPQIPVLDLVRQHLVHDEPRNLDLMIQLDKALVLKLSRLLIPLDEGNVVDSGTANGLFAAASSLHVRGAVVVGYRARVVVELAIVIKVEHLVVIVATFDIHYLLVLGPVDSDCVIAMSEGPELVFADAGIPLGYVVLVIHYFDEVLHLYVFAETGVYAHEWSSLVELAATVPRGHRAVVHGQTIFPAVGIGKLLSHHRVDKANDTVSAEIDTFLLLELVFEGHQLLDLNVAWVFPEPLFKIVLFGSRDYLFDFFFLISIIDLG